MNDNALKSKFGTGKRPTGSDFSALIETKRRRDEGRVIRDVQNGKLTLDDGTQVAVGGGIGDRIGYDLKMNVRDRPMLPVKTANDSQPTMYTYEVPTVDFVFPRTKQFELELYDAKLLLRNPVLVFKRFAPRRHKNGFTQSGKTLRISPAGFYNQPEPFESYDRRSSVAITSLRQVIDMVPEGYFCFYKTDLSFYAKGLSSLSRAKAHRRYRTDTALFADSTGDDRAVKFQSQVSNRGGFSFMAPNGAYVKVLLELQLDGHNGGTRERYPLQVLKVKAVTSITPSNRQIYITQMLA